MGRRVLPDQNGGGSSWRTGLRARSARCPRRPRRPSRCAGRPCQEREVDSQRYWDVRLRDEYGAGLGQHGADALLRWQEAVLGPLGLGGVEPCGDLDGAVGEDAALDLAGGLLRADEDNADRLSSLGL
jgi:hypothetical protein